MKPYLVVARAQKAELQFFSTTILASKFNKCIGTREVDLFLAILRFKGDVLPWLPCMLH